MAKTAALLELIDTFSEAFADPSLPVETPEPKDDGNTCDKADEEPCEVIEFELATSADSAGFVVDLPETFARQGTPECPSGLCSN